ncbi:hypothetical protein AAG906_003630 [Vitis piasezkii]
MLKMPQSKELMYVEALVNGKATKALVDTVPLITLSRRMRQESWSSKHPKKGSSWVTMHIGSWEGKVDFTVAPMDDFKMVLGMVFLKKVKVVSLLFLHSMVILKEEKPCMVPTVTKGTPKTPMLSVMQVKKGLKRKEVIYLAT